MVKVSKHSSNTELTFLFAGDYKVHWGVDESEEQMPQWRNSLTVYKLYHLVSQIKNPEKASVIHRPWNEGNITTSRILILVTQCTKENTRSPLWKDMPWIFMELNFKYGCNVILINVSLSCFYFNPSFCLSCSQGFVEEALLWRKEEDPATGRAV